MKASLAQRRPTTPSLLVEHDAQRKTIRLVMKGWPVAIVSGVIGLAAAGVVWTLAQHWR
jgi:hypothetical protein